MNLIIYMKILLFDKTKRGLTFNEGLQYLIESKKKNNEFARVFHYDLFGKREVKYNLLFELQSAKS